MTFDPDWVVAPGSTLRDWREENGVSETEAARRCGLTLAMYLRVEEGDEPITPMMAEALTEGTGISAEFWLNLERSFRDGLKAGKTWTR